MGGSWRPVSKNHQWLPLLKRKGLPSLGVVVTISGVGGVDQADHQQLDKRPDHGQHHRHPRTHNTPHSHKHHHRQTPTLQDAFQIVFPKIIADDDAILNDNTSTLHRRKRNSEHSNKPLHISISGSGENFELELWQNEQLLAPGFKVYHRQTLRQAQESGAGERTAAPVNVSPCHFIGNVKSHRDQSAAISTCSGMKGLIRTDKDDYIIEPIREASIHGKDGFVGQPHKLYKRSLVQANKQEFYEAQKSAQQDITIEQDVDLLHDLEDLENVEKVADGDVNPPADGHSIGKRAAYKYKFLRQKSMAKTVEVLVVVDKNMYHKHGDANITTYTLTLFNMLSQLFRDGSLGNRINVVLVGLILLEGDERGLTIDYNADDTLNSFCSWQSVLIGANGRQHDHAILLTGLDLCSYKNSPCDTLGFAPMEGMCNRVRSCTVNEDTGLSTAFTIAHEVGHNFGMFHDGEGNYCTQSAGKIMSPTLMGKDGQFHWSVCSKAYLMRFLNTPQSVCLDDRPKQVAELRFPDKLPGELYNADIQCKWQFGNKARLCTYDFGKDICKALWCFRGNKRCETKFLPAAEGTSCGDGMWCRKGQCVDYGHNGPRPIQGQWSTWSDWSDCSSSCDGGIMTRRRECSRPLPQYGGKTCEGGDKVHKVCNVQSCPEDAEDYHTVQCATYNKQPFQGWYLQWKPQKKLNDVNEPCKLHCIADTPSYVFTIKHTATDGMGCGIDEDSICAEGECMRVGCDLIVGSGLRNDMCGVCNGDNSTCRLIQGEYLEQPKLNTYFPVTILPKLARSIRIWEKSISSNYLAMRNIFGAYYLNGQQRVAWPGTYEVAGAKFRYSRPYNEPEMLRADGPLNEELVLEILVQDRNPGIKYEYTLPLAGDETDTNTTAPSPEYTWSMSVSSCSEPCATGKKSVSAVCHKNFVEEVEPSFCAGQTKPETGLLPCNEQPCEPRWVVDEWSKCSRECGAGKQRRRARCRQKISAIKDKKLKKKYCEHLKKPGTKQKCNPQECPPAWHAGKWTKCSATCGAGQQKRKVTCRSKKGRMILPDSMCHTPKLDDTRSCENIPCNETAKLTRMVGSCKPDQCKARWVPSEWTLCSKPCKGGVQKRRVRCYNDRQEQIKNRYCRPTPKPARKQKCNVGQCKPAWSPTEWSECSQSCGSGEQTRQIHCRMTGSRDNKALPEKMCPSPKPNVIRSCDLGSCDYQDQYDWLLSPWGPCSVTCGQGEQTRIVSCVDLRGQPADGCEDRSMPSYSRPCDRGQCLPTPLGHSGCMDKFSWCYLVPHHKVCNNPLYTRDCCRSCSQR